MSLTRFGVSIDSSLLKKFDRKIKEKGYTNRSEAFRDMVRDSFIQEKIESGSALMVGTVTLIFSHHEMELPKKLAHEQHEHHDMVLSSIHVHLDHHNCMEVILLKGKAKEISDFANKLISRKGVKYGKLTLAEAEM